MDVEDTMVTAVISSAGRQRETVGSGPETDQAIGTGGSGGTWLGEGPEFTIRHMFSVG